MVIKFIGEDGFYPKWAQGEGRWVCQRVLVITGHSNWFNLPPPPESERTLVWVPPKSGFLGLGKISPDEEASRASMELRQIPFKCLRCGWQGMGNELTCTNPIYQYLICPECLNNIDPDLRALSTEVIVNQWDKLGRPCLEMPAAASNLIGTKPIDNLPNWITSFQPMTNELAYVGQQLWSNFASFIRDVQKLEEAQRINTEKFKKVVKGFVYFGAGDKDLYALYALDAQTGKLVWKYETKKEIYSSPAVGNKLVYFGSWDKRMRALDSLTGELKWSYETDDTVNSSPAVANGMVYFGSRDGNLYALDAMTGKAVWSFSTGGSIICSPKILGKFVYFGSEDGTWYALNADNGNIKWTFRRELDSDDDEELGYKCVGAYHNVVYFIGSDEKLYALNAMTGELIWNYYDKEVYEEDSLGGIDSVAIDKSGEVYCSGILVNADIVVLNEKTGEIIRKFDNSKDVEHILPDLNGNLTVANGIVYIAGSDAFYAIGGETGNVLWKYSNDESPSFKEPFLVDMIVCFTRDKTIYALDAITGDCKWSYELKYEISTRPCIHLTDEEPVRLASHPDKNGLSCPNCGYKIGKTAKFCKECGCNLKLEGSKHVQPKASSLANKCSRHPQLDTIGVCAECGVGVCVLCKSGIKDKLYCPNCIGKRIINAEKQQQPPASAQVIGEGVKRNLFQRLVFKSQDKELALTTMNANIIATVLSCSKSIGDAWANFTSQSPSQKVVFGIQIEVLVFFLHMVCSRYAFAKGGARFRANFQDEIVESAIEDFIRCSSNKPSDADSSGENMVGTILDKYNESEFDYGYCESLGLQLDGDSIHEETVLGKLVQRINNLTDEGYNSLLRLHVFTTIVEHLDKSGFGEQVEEIHRRGILK